MSQIHASHLERLAEQRNQRLQRATQRDEGQIYGATHDRWLNAAQKAVEQRKHDLALGVPQSVADKAYEAKIAKIRVGRDHAHSVAEGRRERGADDKEASRYRAHILSADDYKQFLQQRLGALDPGSQMFSELTKRLNALVDGQAKAGQQAQKIESHAAKQRQAASDRTERSQLAAHKISLADYQSYLQQRLAVTQQGTADWDTISNRIASAARAGQEQSVRLLTEKYRSGNLTGGQYHEQLATMLGQMSEGTALYDSTQRRLLSIRQDLNSLPEWASKTGDSIAEMMGRCVDSSLTHWNRFRSFHNQLWHDVRQTAREGLASGAGSLVRGGIQELSRAALGGLQSFWRHGTGKAQSTAHPDEGIQAADSISSAGRSLKDLPQTLATLKSGFSNLLHSLTSGFSQAAMGLQSLLALSGSEGKQRQRHSLFGGLLGGIAGAFVGNWFGGAQIGSALGGMFAEGGSPPVGVPSIVGERGPELFVPREAGTVVPKGSFPHPGQVSGSGWSARPVQVTVNHYGDIHGGDDVQRMYTQIPQAVVNALPTAKAGV